ncbi:hypothetical protein BYT27DRAFT_7191790 [Phlegmacium glaucopus]|nr:hypothetical protein BYT27DRAFT_7191790 [Phlegmacium glaucopus]
MSNPTNGSDSWFDFLSRSNPVNESHGTTSGRKSSSSTWPRNSDADARHNKAGDDNRGSFDGRKESAVRGESVEGGRVAQGDVDLDNPILLSPEEKASEGDAKNGQSDDAARTDEEKT